MGKSLTPLQRLARRRYAEQKGSAKRRGIPFLLTFEQWWKIWQTSGHWKRRGRAFMMTRTNDEGPYAVGNVKIGTAGDNAATRDARCSSDLKGVRRTSKSREWWARIRIAGHFVHLGYFETARDAHIAYVFASIEYHKSPWLPDRLPGDPRQPVFRYVIPLHAVRD